MSGFQTDVFGPFIESNPSDNRDYSFDWSSILQQDETISTSNWTVPAPLVAGAKAINATVTTQWISGGVDQCTYRISNTIVTNQGRMLERSFRLVVQASI